MLVATHVSVGRLRKPPVAGIKAIQWLTRVFNIFGNDIPSYFIVFTVREEGWVGFCCLCVRRRVLQQIIPFRLGRPDGREFR